LMTSSAAWMRGFDVGMVCGRRVWTATNSNTSGLIFTRAPRLAFPRGDQCTLLSGHPLAIGMDRAVWNYQEARKLHENCTKKEKNRRYVLSGSFRAVFVQFLQF